MCAYGAAGGDRGLLLRAGVRDHRAGQSRGRPRAEWRGVDGVAVPGRAVPWMGRGAGLVAACCIGARGSGGVAGSGRPGHGAAGSGWAGNRRGVRGRGAGVPGVVPARLAVGIPAVQAVTGMAGAPALASALAWALAWARASARSKPAVMLSIRASR